MPMVLKATFPYSENLCIPNFGMEYSFGPEIWVRNCQNGCLVGGFNPSEKYQSGWIIIPTIGGKKHVPNHQPVE